MQTINCPVCHSDVIVDDEAVEGDIFDCQVCGEQLEITSLHPIQATIIKGSDDELEGFGQESENDDQEEEEDEEEDEEDDYGDGDETDKY